MILNIMRSHLDQRVRGTFLGHLWILANPLITLLVHLAIFPLLFGQTESKYILPLGVKVIFWSFFVMTVQMTMGSYHEFRFYIQNRLFNLSVPPMVITLENFFIHAFILVPFSIMTILFSELDISIFFRFLIPMLTMFFVTYFVAHSLLILVMKYRDIKFIVDFLTKVGYFLLPIFYSSQAIDQKLGASIFSHFHLLATPFNMVDTAVTGQTNSFSLASAFILIALSGFILNQIKKRFTSNLGFHLD